MLLQNVNKIKKNYCASPHLPDIKVESDIGTSVIDHFVET